MSTLRKCNAFTNAWVVLIPESNLGFEAQHYIGTFTRERVRDWVVLREGPRGSVGFLTTHDTKEASCKLVHDMLNTKQLSTHPSLVSCSMGSEDAQRMLLDQMRRFQVIVQPATSVFGQSRRTFTGKVGGGQDDLIIALQIAVIGARVFRTKDAYKQYWGM